MNAIIGFSDLLTNEIKDQKHRSYLSAIISGGKILLSLINDILDLSKIEAGRMELVYSEVNPRSICIEIRNIFSAKVAEKNLDFQIRLAEDVPVALFLDEIRLRQILFNLVGNAVKFTESGFVRLEMSTVRTDDNFCRLHITITDSGIGIAEDQLDSIFEAFRQQKGQNSGKYGGTGLGLTITRHLLEMMDGQISVESRPSHGSSFTIILNRVEIAGSRSSRSDEAQTQQQYLFSPARILIADDIASNRELLSEYLKEFNFELFYAYNGREAIEQAKANLPDLIFMDLRMPVMGGLEAIRQIRSNELTAAIPVVILSASSIREDEDEISRITNGSYLRKPVSKAEIVQQLARFLSYTVLLPVVEPGMQPDSSSQADIVVSIQHPAVLLTELNDILYPQWRTIRQSYLFDDILQFAENIINLGKIHAAMDLINWGSNLFFQAKNFDMEKLPETLEQFPEIVKNLEKSAGT